MERAVWVHLDDSPGQGTAYASDPDLAPLVMIHLAPTNTIADMRTGISLGPPRKSAAFETVRVRPFPASPQDSSLAVHPSIRRRVVPRYDRS
ncbi:hypothetical protein VTO73DRAFT_1860 [Trametes versicolor]